MTTVGGPPRVYYGNNSCKVFVAGFPVDAEEHDIKAGILKWEGVIQNLITIKKGSDCKYAYVEFRNERRRDEFVAQHNKKKFQFQNQILDVRKHGDKARQYLKQPVPNPASGQPTPAPSPVVVPAPVQLQQQQQVVPTRPLGPIAKPVSDNLAVVSDYLSEDIGLLRSQLHGNGVFNFNSVIYCKVHGRMCKEFNCKNFIPIKFDKSKANLKQLLQVGEHVKMVYRKVEDCRIVLKGKVISFQAILIWPSYSKEPIDQNLKQWAPDDVILDSHLINLMDYPEERENTNSNTDKNGVGPIGDFYRRPPTDLNLGGFNTEPRRPTSFIEEMPRSNFNTTNHIDDLFTRSYYDEDVVSVSSSSTKSKNDETMINMDLTEKLQTFLEHSFSFDGRSAKDLKLLKLSHSIINIKGDLSDMERRGTLMIHDFVKSYNIQVDKDKFSVIISHFKVLLHQLYGRRPAQTVIPAAEKKLEQEITNIIKDKITKKSQESNGIPDSWSDLASEVSEDTSARGEKGLFDYTFVSNDLLPVVSFSSDLTNSILFKITLDDTNSKKFHHLANWIEDAYRNTETLFQPCPTAHMSKAVLSSWLNGKRDIEQLKDDLRKMIFEPKDLFAYWSDIVETSWLKTSPYPTVASDFVIQATFLFFWNQVANTPQISTEEFNMFSRTMLNLPFVNSNSGNLYNVRGIVVHYFNNYIGVIQTEHGRVLFDFRLASVPKTGNGAEVLKWTKCDGIHQIPVGTMVKLHAKKRRFQVQKKKHEFRFATKLWLMHCFYEAEPVFGAEVPGGEKFWKETFAQFENVVRVNVKMFSEANEMGQQSAKYNDVINTLLEEGSNVNPHLVRKGGKTQTAINQGELKDFQPFLDWLAPSEKSKSLATIKYLLSLGIGYNELKCDFIGKSLLGADDLFAESLECILLFSSQEKEGLMNIVPQMHSYFTLKDNKQLDDAKKSICGNITFLVSNVCKNQLPLSNSRINNPTGDADGFTKQISVPENTFKLLLERIITLETIVQEMTTEKSQTNEMLNMLLTKVDKLEKAGSINGVVKAIKKAWNVSIVDKMSCEKYEFQTSEEGNLSVRTLKAIWPNMNALKYQFNGVTRICSQNGDFFEMPEDGWGEREYVVNFSVSTNITTSGATGVNPAHNISPFAAYPYNNGLAHLLNGNGHPYHNMVFPK